MRSPPAHPRSGAAFFSGSFVVTGAMIVLNLFVGVMLNGMEEARKEQEFTTEISQRFTVRDKLTEKNIRMD